jgi:hypothetical protein
MGNKTRKTVEKQIKRKEGDRREESVCVWAQVCMQVYVLMCILKGSGEKK